MKGKRGNLFNKKRQPGRSPVKMDELGISKKHREMLKGSIYDKSRREDIPVQDISVEFPDATKVLANVLADTMKRMKEKP